MKSFSAILPFAFIAVTLASPLEKRTEPTNDTLLKTPVSEYLFSTTDKITVKKENGICGNDDAKAGCIDLHIRQGTVVGAFYIQRQCNCDLVINGGSNLNDFKQAPPAANKPSTSPVVPTAEATHASNPTSTPSATPALGSASSPTSLSAGVVDTKHNMDSTDGTNEAAHKNPINPSHSKRADDASRFSPSEGYVLRFEHNEGLDKYVQAHTKPDGNGLLVNETGDIFSSTPDGVRVTFKSWVKQ